MLAFARKQPLEARVLDLNEIVTRMVAMLRQTLGEHIRVETALRTRPLAAPGRPVAAGGCHPQPRGQCARRHAEGRPAPAGDGQRAPGRAVRARQRRGDARRLRCGVRHRFRDRHGARGDRARLRAILHDQGGRPRHRTGALHGLWLRQAVARACEDLQRARVTARASSSICRGPPTAAALAAPAVSAAPEMHAGRPRDHPGRGGRRGRARGRRHQPGERRLSGAAGSRRSGRARDPAAARRDRSSLHRPGHAERHQRSGPAAHGARNCGPASRPSSRPAIPSNSSRAETRRTRSVPLLPKPYRRQKLIDIIRKVLEGTA